MKLRRALILFTLLLSMLIVRGGEAPAPTVDVILWFDTEDFLLPADDDAAKRLCDMLTERKIRATFKIVGEKARVLKRRGRTDVIDALKKHDIGYHSDYHSVHPTPTEFLAECGLMDGIAEFVRRQGKGAADVRAIFGVETLSCYGQPGSSWASQGVAALKQIGVAPHGIPCYVDEGAHIGLNDKPFWYCGALNVFKMRSNKTRITLLDPESLEPGKKNVTAIADRLRNEGGGLISIYYHPCEWVHREFWDGVNFKRGANPPRDLWRAPGQLTEVETEGAFMKFAAYIDHIRAIPNVRFVTATELPEMYPDRVRTEGASAADLDTIAAKILDEKTVGVDAITIEDRAYSAAEQFELFAQALNDVNRIGAVNYPLRPVGALGPDSMPPAVAPSARPENAKLAWGDFVEGLRDARDYLQAYQRIPSRIFIGANVLSPADFLSALAAAYVHLRKTGSLPKTEGVAIRSMELIPVKQVAVDTPKLFGDWIIHKENFQAPKVLEIARLQTWTLKPAIRKTTSAPPAKQ